MINLIPPNAQRQVKREYWIRVVSVWLFILGSALFILAIIHVPAYVLVQSQLASYQKQYDQASDTSKDFKDSETAITTANDTAKLLTEKNEAISFSRIIEEIEEHVQSGITIINFSISLDKDKINPILITGEAASRAVLSEFRAAIENDESFKRATLPLSDLAKDKDIPFSITIVPE